MLEHHHHIYVVVYLHSTIPQPPVLQPPTSCTQCYPSLNTQVQPPTVPWVGGSTAPPSAPTAALVGRGQGVCLTEESCREVRGGIRRQHVHIDWGFGCVHLQHPLLTHRLSADAAAALCAQHHYIPMAGHWQESACAHFICPKSVTKKLCQWLQ